MVDSSTQALNYLLGEPVPATPTEYELRRGREEADARESLLYGGYGGW